MTTNPEDGMRAIGELENGRYHRLLERVAEILEIRIERQSPLNVIRVWRDAESTSTFADYSMPEKRLFDFFYGLAVGIQGDWTP